ncbi:MAG: SlyX family protein [Treponema sp.]|jgi:SlyX protein|nr:SlyX family protein [Treponema sp.]
MDRNEFDERLVRIETRLAYLEDFLTRLQGEVVDRNALMDRLSTEHTALKIRLARISRDLEEMPEKKPPHY